MSRGLLVVTTVHNPDDTRIRERLVRTLQRVGEVSYATPEPGPTDRTGLSWIGLRGTRIQRNLEALRLMMRRSWSLIVVHDPELVPAGVLARWLRRVPVVFDVHEDLAEQVRYKTWVPWWAKPVVRVGARLLYWLAERALTLTLAEPGYRRLFARDHPVFPNYPRSDQYPPARPGNGAAVYVGDITRPRGVEDAVAACGSAGIPLVLVGGVEDGLRADLEGSGRPDLSFTGRVANPEAVAMMAEAAVGLSPLRDHANYRTSLPTKTLEYLAVGIPVVATDLPGTREVLDGLDSVWLVPPGDVEAMAGALAEATHPKARSAAAAQAETIRRRFSWPEDEVLSFYRRLLDR